MAGNLMIQSIDTDNRIFAKFSDKYLPRHARHGELYVVGGILYIFDEFDTSGSGKWLPLTAEKEVFTYEVVAASVEWNIPVEFTTTNLQIVVYDVNDKVYPHPYTYDVQYGNVKISFENPVAGKAYLVIDKADTDTSAFGVAIAKLTSDLSSEITRATDTETTIQNDVSALSAALDTEVSRALTVEGTLQTNINVEKLRIDAILDASSADADTFKEIVDLVNSVDTTNDNTFAGYVLSNNDRSTAIELSVSNEISRATTAEGILQTNINLEGTTRSSEISNVTSLLTAEIVRATEVEADIQTSILNTQTSITNETSARIEAVNAIQQNVINEASTRLSVDEAIQSSLETETNRAIAAEENITTLVNNETTRATTVENILGERLTTEISDREQAISTKQDVLVSGMNIKTVNGQIIVGSGDVDLNTDLVLNGKHLEYTNIDGVKQSINLSNYCLFEDTIEAVDATPVVVDTLTMASIRSAEYTFTCSAGGYKYHCFKVSLIHNDSDAFITVYGEVGISNGTISTTTSDGVISVIFTPSVMDGVEIKFNKHVMSNSKVLSGDLNLGSGTIDINAGGTNIDLNK